MVQTIDTITLGSGCFWCTEAIYQRLDGVVSVTSGYAGGHVNQPTYEAVCEGTTGHAEVCQIVYDTTKVSLDDILMVFWKTHDPTTLNRQGGDIGTQYRSVIFYHDEKQLEIAKAYKNQLELSNTYINPIVTTFEPFNKFFSAEDYHQNYYENHKDFPYCEIVITPKVLKLEKDFKNLLNK